MKLNAEAKKQHIKTKITKRSTNSSTATESIATQATQTTHPDQETEPATTEAMTATTTYTATQDTGLQNKVRKGWLLSSQPICIKNTATCELNWSKLPKK